MANLERIRVFYHVAKEGSMKKALKTLGKNYTTISKNILDLEAQMNVQLFIRRKRGLELTVHGMELLKVAQRTIPELEKSIQPVNETRDHDKTLRIITTTGFASIWLIRKLSKFIKSNPDIKLRIVTTNEEVDFINTKADIGILPKITTADSLNQKKLFTVHSKLFASSEYLEKYGYPKNREDLINHKIISFYPDLMGYRGNVDWHLHNVTNEQNNVSVNSAYCQLEAAACGLGILAIACEFPRLENYNLQEVLPNEQVCIDGYFITRADIWKTQVIQMCYEALIEEN